MLSRTAAARFLYRRAALASPRYSHSAPRVAASTAVPPPPPPTKAPPPPPGHGTGVQGDDVHAATTDGNSRSIDAAYGGPTLSADLTPARIVAELDRHIIGQADAKKAMAIALRNRWRRLQLSPELREEVLPKCCLLIGSTGVGKTEIARRLSKLVDAPFIKVEATKFTEVGFHGRDVEQIIRDLLENAITLARNRQRRLITARLATEVEERILDQLTGVKGLREEDINNTNNNRNSAQGAGGAAGSVAASSREHFRVLLRQGALEAQTIEVEEASTRKVPSLQMDMTPEKMSEVFARVDKLFTVRQSGGATRRRVSVGEARRLYEEAECERLLSDELVVKEAIESVQNSGIVVIDEIDKIATPAGHRHGADASSEGVQRDLLPLIEGTTVATKHGNVKTDHILFVAAGAFSQSKPSDLMAELVGRLPIRVELKPLTVQDLRAILTVPEHSLIRQQVALLATEGVALRFTDAAIDKIAQVTAEINNTVENIGARRLHTVIERIIENTSFNAPDLRGQTVVVDAVQVQGALGDLMVKSDLSRFIL